jgi:hypothetical protein
MYKLTLDGVDVMGERLAQEIVEETNKRPQIRKISFVAHSVGGLVARYAIGRLYRPPKQTSQSSQNLNNTNKGTIHGLEAVNFITVASPHLGSRGNKQVLLKPCFTVLNSRIDKLFKTFEVEQSLAFSDMNIVYYLTLNCYTCTNIHAPGSRTCTFSSS